LGLGGLKNHICPAVQERKVDESKPDLRLWKKEGVHSTNPPCPEPVVQVCVYFGAGVDAVVVPSVQGMSSMKTETLGDAPANGRPRVTIRPERNREFIVHELASDREKKQM
jgi:hypothetical protein